MFAELVLLCEDGAKEVDALGSRLAVGGVALKSFREIGSRTPLVAVAAEIDARIIEQVGVYASLRPERLLVVVLRQSEPTVDELHSVLAAGAADVIALGDGQRIQARLERWLKVDALADSDTSRRLAVGASACWLNVVRKSVELALFSRIPLLLSGETGTGKEQIARLVHELDPRPAKAAFVVLDCATVAPELAGSEFFGHERGAFTGALVEREGAFFLAHGGTLFLDEIGELPLPLQGQLLRVIQEGAYKRLGGNVWRHTSFRLICATNRDLTEEVKRGRFREDLFHRLCGWSMRLPPLRERSEDIVPLAEHFLAQYALLRGSAQVSLSVPVRSFLTTRAYPGNARELRHVVARLADLHAGSGPITLGDLAVEERSAVGKRMWYDAAYIEALRRALNSRIGLKNIVRITRKLAIEAAADDEGANVQRMAAKLMVSKVALYQHGEFNRAAAARSPLKATG